MNHPPQPGWVAGQRNAPSDRAARFLSEDDGVALGASTRYAEQSAVRLVMYRVAARLQHDVGLWQGIPTTDAIYAAYIDHSWNDLDASWRELSLRMVSHPIEDYVAAAKAEQKPPPRVKKRRGR